MGETSNLKLPLLVYNQAGKEITHNEALIIIDAMLNNGVIDFVTTPPETPGIGSSYIIKATATDAFEEKENRIAFYNSGWKFIEPKTGCILWVNSESKLYVFNDTTWQEITTGNGNINTLQEISLLGINTTADSNNKLSVKSDYVLFDKATDNSKVKVNKATSTNTASHLFQSNYEGKAEFGLIGNDDFTLKVSHDGSTWNNAFVVDKTTGNIDFKQNFTIKNYEPCLLKKEQITLNNAAEIIFNNLDDGYNHIFEFVSISASENSVNLLIRFSIDGTTYDTAGNYQYSAMGQTRTGDKTVGVYPYMFSSCNGYNSDNTDNAFRLAQTTYSASKNTQNLSNAIGVTYNATIELFNPSVSTGNKIISYKEIFRQSNLTSLFLEGQGIWTQNSSYKAIKFAFTAGTFAGGIIKHYIKK